MCILQLDVPRSATVTIEEEQYGTQRQIEIRQMSPGEIRAVCIRIEFQDGRQEERRVLIEGGRLVRLAFAEPGASRPELALQRGHSSSIECVALSADGRHMLTGSMFMAILWDATTGTELRTFQGNRWLNSLAISPDGLQVLTAYGASNAQGLYTTITLSDAVTGKKLSTFQMGELFRCATFSPDGRHVLTVSDDEPVVLWDALTGEKLRAFREPISHVLSVALNPSGQELFISHRDKAVTRWDVATGKKVGTLHTTQPVHSIMASPDGRQLLTGGGHPLEESAEVILWDAVTGRELRTFHGHTSYVTSVALSLNGRQVITGSADNTAIVWNAATGEKLHTYSGHKSGVRFVAFSPDDRQILTVAGRRFLWWDATTGKKLRSFCQSIDSVLSVAFSPNGKKVIIGSHNNTAVLWDLASGRVLHTLPLPATYVSRVAFNRDGTQVLTACWDNDKVVTLWDPATGRKLRQISQAGGDEAAQYGILNSVAISPDGRQILTAGGDFSQKAAEIILWDVRTAKKLRSFEQRKSIVKCVAFSPDGRHFLSGSGDYFETVAEVILRDARTGKTVLTFEQDGGFVKSAAFSPDSRKVLSAGGGDLILWDAATGQELRRFEGHAGWVSSVAFSPDGQQVLTGSSDETGRLWGADTGRELRRFEGHTASVESVAFSPDGQQVLTGSLDGTSRLWDVPTGEELVRMISFDEGKDWLAVTPEGLFDGSGGGREKAMFRVGGVTVVPLDRFFRDFYHPGLLAEIWQGKRPMPDKELGRDPAPEVQILLRDPVRRDSNRVTIDVAMTDRGGGMKEPWLFHNGLRTGQPQHVRKDGKTLQCSFIVSLVEGENRIEVQSASEDGSWESESAVFTIPFEGELPAPELRVLAIGINEYKSGDNLEGCVAGVRAMIKLLEDHAADQYAKVHVYPDEAGLCDADATRQGIDDAIADIAKEANPQDTLVVYVAGHGWTIGQKYYLLPHEYQQAQGQTINEAVREWGLPIDELGSRLSQVPALKRVLIFDTCMSGSVAKSERSPFEFRGAVERFARSQGIFTLAASAEDANAFEHPMTGNMGILTFTLLAGIGAVEDEHDLLDGAAIKPNGEVDVLEWFRFAEEHVPRLVEHLQSQKDYHTEMRGREPSFALLRTE